jgi:DNA polymerase-1
MAKIIYTADRANFPERGNAAYYVYNGLDCCITREVLDEIEPLLDEDTLHVYDFQRQLQNPVLEMNGRGILVDKPCRDIMVSELRKEATKLDAIVQEFSHAIWDQPLNASSPAQLSKLFYGVLQIPEVRVNQGGAWKVSTNREALEKISVYLHARPMTSAILAYKDAIKKIQTLTTGIDRDGRFRTSYNITGTVTGRWSSSENAWGTGGNLQNITNELREIFIADEGKKLAYLDLEQAESRAVGLLAFLCIGNDGYLKACESGDLHTVVSKLCWPNLGWSGDNKGDREIAEQLFFRHFSYRDLAKRGGHGTNYYGRAPTIAKNLRIEVAIAQQFQTAYFKAFPEIKQWHDHTAKELRSNGFLTTPFRRRRCFFDRLTDDATLRAAIAYVPQSMIADMLNESLYHIWRDLSHMGVEVLLQVHDAVVIQYPEDREDEILKEVFRLMRKHYVFNGRPFSIGSDAQVGWNWGKYISHEDVAKARAKGDTKKQVNLDGIRAYKGTDSRKRTRKPNAIEHAPNKNALQLLQQIAR